MPSLKSPQVSRETPANPPHRGSHGQAEVTWGSSLLVDNAEVSHFLLPRPLFPRPDPHQPPACRKHLCFVPAPQARLLSRSRPRPLPGFLQAQLPLWSPLGLQGPAGLAPGSPQGGWWRDLPSSGTPAFPGLTRLLQVSGCDTGGSPGRL